MNRTRRLCLTALLGALLAACGPTPDGADDGADGSDDTRALAGASGLGGAGGDLPGFGLNDVSILFPLPEASGDGLYRAADLGGQGELLPLDVFQVVGPIARRPCTGSTPVGCENTEPVETTHPRLRVVGVRIDPCFRALGETMCRRQVRLVMQPVDGGVFDDDALHVFYELPKGEFDGLVAELATISQSTPKDLPLSVHPLLREQGTQGAYAQALKNALFPRIGRERISRVTAMEMTLIGGGWTFRGFEFEDGRNPTPIGITGTSEQEQKVSGFGTIIPPTPAFSADAPFSLLWDAEKSELATDAERKAAYNHALAIENPAQKTVEEVSCAACHTALAARLAVEKTFGLSAQDNANAFASSFDLTLTSRQDVREEMSMLHAFSYSGDDFGISQRTVHETAAVADSLNSTY